MEFSHLAFHNSCSITFHLLSKTDLLNSLFDQSHYAVTPERLTFFPLALHLSPLPFASLNLLFCLSHTTSFFVPLIHCQTSSILFSSLTANFPSDYCIYNQKQIVKQSIVISKLIIDRLFWKSIHPNLWSVPSCPLGSLLAAPWGRPVSLCSWSLPAGLCPSASLAS